ncbi:MAG TPA: hypothetical protein VFH30_09240 [Acidimicrobiales bacterium]|nr:hypothetical protein [Acidimicrobiales bacterium]
MRAVERAHRCRWCRGTDGEVVLDLGDQPAADHFPAVDDPGLDLAYPLQIWLCAGCGLAQLLVDPTVPEEPRRAEPAALVERAADAVERVATAGRLPAGARAAEYGSPHGGPCLSVLAERGMVPVDDGEQADVVLDCSGLMHADQVAAQDKRAARMAPGGVLLLQFHSGATILRLGQWNSLGHGHYAYYSTPALARMLAAAGFVPRQAWRFDLYGGTVLLAASLVMTVGATPALAAIRPAAVAACSLGRPPLRGRPGPRPRPAGQRDVPGRGAASVARRPEGRRVHRGGLRAPPRVRWRSSAAPASTAVCCPPWPMRRPPSRVAACPRLTSR